MGRANIHDEEIRNMYKLWLENFLEIITEDRGGEWNITFRRL
jgi:hypothetical protein